MVFGLNFNKASQTLMQKLKSKLSASANASAWVDATQNNSLNNCTIVADSLTINNEQKSVATSSAELSVTSTAIAEALQEMKNELTSSDLVLMDANLNIADNDFENQVNATLNARCSDSARINAMQDNNQAFCHYTITNDVEINNFQFADAQSQCALEATLDALATATQSMDNKLTLKGLNLDFIAIIIIVIAITIILIISFPFISTKTFFRNKENKWFSSIALTCFLMIIIGLVGFIICKKIADDNYINSKLIYHQNTGNVISDENCKPQIDYEEIIFSSAAAAVSAFSDDEKYKKYEGFMLVDEDGSTQVTMFLIKKFDGGLPCAATTTKPGYIFTPIQISESCGEEGDGENNSKCTIINSLCTADNNIVCAGLGEIFGESCPEEFPGCWLKPGDTNHVFLGYRPKNEYSKDLTAIGHTFGSIFLISLILLIILIVIYFKTR